MPIQIVEQQARYLAAENKRNDPDITDVYWFPNEDEVRLVEVNATVPESLEEQIRPFYFRPAPAEQLPAPSGIALIRPNEVRRLRPPAEWGNWDTAVRIEEQG